MNGCRITCCGKCCKYSGFSKWHSKYNQQEGDVNEKQDGILPGVFETLEKKGFSIRPPSSPDYVADIYHKNRQIAFYGRQDTDVFQKKANDQQNAVELENKGNELMAQGQYESAITFYQTAQAIYIRLELPELADGLNRKIEATRAGIEAEAAPKAEGNSHAGNTGIRTEARAGSRPSGVWAWNGAATSLCAPWLTGTAGPDRRPPALMPFQFPEMSIDYTGSQTAGPGGRGRQTFLQTINNPQ